MKIGICGGTFDPFHRGHLDPILAVRDAMQWTRIIYVPARRQPFKLDRGSASGYHRFAMAALATQGIDYVWISPWELERDAVSYTVDTLETLRAEYPDATLDWIIGDDNVAQLADWKSLRRILELANFVVLSRGGVAVGPSVHGIEEKANVKISIATSAALRPAFGALVVAGNSTIPISSTEVRKRA